MDKTTSGVIKAFVAGAAGPTGGRHGVSTNDGVAFSYNEPVAVLRRGRVAFVTTDQWSCTTSRHVNAVAAALRDAGYEVVELSFVTFCRGRYAPRATLLRATSTQALRAFAAKTTHHPRRRCDHGAASAI